MTDEARSAEEITAAVLEAVRTSVEQYLGRRVPGDREEARAFLRETIFDSLPTSTSYTSLDVMQKEMAADAAVDLLEPFVHGMPEGYDPRRTLGRTSDVALKMLEERFQDVLDQQPFTLIRYERLRRDEKIHDWGFKRFTETEAQLWLIPIRPAEFITVKIKDAGDLFDGE